MSFKKILLSSVVLFFGMNSFSYAEDVDIAGLKKQLKAANINFQVYDYGRHREFLNYEYKKFNDEQVKCIGQQLVEINKFKNLITDKDPLKDYLRKFPTINLNMIATSAYIFNDVISSSSDKAIAFTFLDNFGCKIIDAQFFYTKYSEFYKDHVAPEKELNSAIANLTKPEVKNNLSCNEGPRNAKPRAIEISRVTASSGSQER